MKFALAVLVAVLLQAGAPAAATAAESRIELREAIVGVIRQQMDAFQRNDFDAAFSFASPAIQRQLRTPENFIRMVIAGYMPVFRPRSVLFLDLFEDEGHLVQRAVVEGADGDTVIALYPMLRMGDGSWRIDGCFLVGRSGKGI